MLMIFMKSDQRLLTWQKSSYLCFQAIFTLYSHLSLLIYYLCGPVSRVTHAI